MDDYNTTTTTAAATITTTTGMIVFYPSMSHVSLWMRNLSFIRYLFQAQSQWLLAGTSHYHIIEDFDLTTPNGVMANVGVAGIFYLGTSVGSYLCLKYLHKEKR